MKKIVVSLVAAAAAVSLPAAAQAACVQSGTMQYVYKYDDSYSSSAGCAYLRTGSLADHYYYFCTNDDRMILQASEAVTSQTQVYVVASASSCPTAGTSRYMGTPRYMYFR